MKPSDHIVVTVVASNIKVSFTPEFEAWLSEVARNMHVYQSIDYPWRIREEECQSTTS